MRGLFRKLVPFTPDSAGAATVFADAPALIIPLDMNGTVSTFRNRVGVRPESRVRVCSALGARELGYVLGDTDGFADECLALMERYDHEFTVLLHGPVSAMTGIDIASLAGVLEQREGKPVLAVDCSGNEAYDIGLSHALLAVFGRVRTAAARPCPHVNVLGVNAVDHNAYELRELLVRHVARACGADVLGVWGSRDGWEQWRLAGGARENIVCCAGALRVAKAMQAAWGTPYRFIDELEAPVVAQAQAGRTGHARVLVVGEQLLGNLARACLEPYGYEVAVGSFFTMLAERMREGDLRIESELAFERLLREGGYGAVLADEALAPCVPPHLVHVPFEHSAVARVVAQRTRGHTLLTREWLAATLEKLREA